MMRSRWMWIALGLLAGSLAACAPQAEVRQAAQELSTPTPRVPFTMAGELFLSSPQAFLLGEDVLDGYATSSETHSDNARVEELRPDGSAYVQATGRVDGWQRQLDRASGTGPLYVVNVVNLYETADGPRAALSPEWHAEVWGRIESGDLTRLADISGLDAEQLVWQDSTGTIGVEIAYRNLYILLTGPSDGGDQYDFFANLAREYLEWIRAGEK